MKKYEIISAESLESQRTFQNRVLVFMIVIIVITSLCLASLTNNSSVVYPTNSTEALDQALRGDVDKALSDSSKALSDDSNAQTDATQALSDASNAQTDATQALNDASNAQTDATQALSDASNAQTDATQALNDASNAQTDATQALNDASNAQTDATQALADTSANAANIDEISSPFGIYTGNASNTLSSISILIWNDLQYIQDNGVTKISNGRFDIHGDGFYEMTYGINLETIAGSPVLGVYENANGQLWPSAPEVTSVGTVIVSSDDISDETNKQFFFRFSGSYVLARAFVTIKRIG